MEEAERLQSMDKCSVLSQNAKEGASTSIRGDERHQN